jgi:hypothetical protein
MVVEFEHTITIPEQNSKYLNLKDDEGNRFGESLAADRTRYTVVDDLGRASAASQRGPNQIWGSLGVWYRDNDVTPGTLIKILYDENELATDGSHILHLNILQRPAASPISTQQPTVIPQTEVMLGLERQLEDFVEANLGSIEQGFVLYVDSEGKRGRQFETTDAGTIDLLCKDARGKFVVLELKKGATSDAVVGQTMRYVGWVEQNLAQGDVRGIILTHDYDRKLRYAVGASGGKLRVLMYRMKLEFISDSSP